ncbi:MAG TPA: hypothetical protein VK603_03830 [Candidatus Saccharimonadales bacterium]|nr:hypothetical protein [Candidatus Saccharimonadales bacterium]
MRAWACGLQDGREQHAGKGDIISEFCSAGEQRRVFDPSRVLAQVARLGQRQLTQISWHFLAQVDQPLFIWFFQVYCEDVFTTKDLARLRRNQIGKKMFTTKDTKITKFGV